MRSDVASLLRAVLADLADALPRLVLADCLDETGDTADAAWATYLRLAADPAADLGWAAREVSGRLTASLSVPVGEFLADADGLLRLLPAERFTVPVPVDYSVPRDCLGRVTEPIAVAHRGLPLGQSGRRVVIGMVVPTDWDAMAAIHSATTSHLGPVAVAVPGDQLAALVARTFTQALAIVGTRPAPPPRTL